MMTSSMLLKFESTESDEVIILKTLKMGNCQYLGNKMKYEAAICYVEVAYDVDFDYATEI